MKLRQSIIVGGAMTGLLALGATPALAAYQPTTGTGTVSKSRVKAGRTVAFCGSGYAPGSVVTITISGRFYESVTTGSSGGFCAAVKPRRVGRTTLAGSGTGDNLAERTVVASVRVVRRNRDRDRDRDRRAENASWNSRGNSTDSMQLVSATAAPGSGKPLTAAETAALVSASLLLLGTGTGFRVAGRRRRSPIS